MKINKTTIPSGSLTEKYLPADYLDVYACETDTPKEIIPDEMMVNFWTDFPHWINVLIFAHRASISIETNVTTNK